MVSAGGVSAADVTAAARLAGLAGRPVCVHSSLRSFGHVRDGPVAVIQGLLDAGSTVLVPTSTFRFCRAPKPVGAPTWPFNSENDGSIPPPGTVPAHGYDVSAEYVDPAMGAVPAAVLRDSSRIRGDHPLNSFTAIGPDAAALVAGQTAHDVYAPLAELIAHDGVVACMGVGLDATTLLHLAEADAGLRLLRRWALRSDGTTVEAVHGGCSRGFERLANATSTIERRHAVGTSTWRVFDAAALLAVTTEEFRRDPTAGVCADPACVRCRDQERYAAANRLPASASRGVVDTR